jgi:hypothetical protein
LTPFLALQMVNFSSLHDEGRPDEVLYRYHRDVLVNALPISNGHIMVDFGVWREL